MDINIRRFVTRFIDPYKMLECEYGTIEQKEWLKMEAKRIGNCRIIRNEAGEMALIRKEKGEKE